MPEEIIEDNQIVSQIKKPRKKREKPVDRQLVGTLLAQGYTNAAIALKTDTTAQTVWEIKKGTEDRIIQVSDFLRDRANLLAYYQKQHLDLISKLNTSIAKDLEAGLLKGSEKGKILFYLSQGFGIFYDKERLETGKSSSNVSIMQSFMVQALEKV